MPIEHWLARTGSTLLLAAVGPVAASAAGAPSTPPPFVSESTVAAFARAVSGTTAKRTVQELTLHHRQRGSHGFTAASEVIESRLRSYGISTVDVVELPADGSTMYGTQRSRPAWNARSAELWELLGDGDDQRQLVASFAARPVTLAQDSASGRVSGDLVDVGAGTSEADYQHLDIAGRFVLTSSQPSAVRSLAIEQYGAAGVISWAQNQRSAWWGLDDELVRWGHMGSFPVPNAFAFMVSPRQAAVWRRQLASGDRVHLDARVDAGQEPGSYRIVTASIPGADPDRGQEIAFSCHLDHQRPGANDNASGCAAILEAARVLHRLIEDGSVPRPTRTIRWYWPAEIEATIALLAARPEIPARTGAVIHMDMVGGDPAITKARFHVTRGPASLPHFANDVASAFARFVNVQTDAYAAAEGGRYPLTDPEGGREPLAAVLADFSMGSDHAIWAEGSWQVPAIYFNDWPDRYIHTHKDSVANIDATKMLRAAFLGAITAYTLADLGDDDLPSVWDVIRRRALARSVDALERSGEAGAVDLREEGVVLQRRAARERAVAQSIGSFLDLPPAFVVEADQFYRTLDATLEVPVMVPQTNGPGAHVVFSRRATPKGPMNGFGYSYLDDQLAIRGLERPELLDYAGAWGSGAEYAYEALNLVDGLRSATSIRDELAATYGPVPLQLVVEYLRTLESIEILTEVQ